jgi:hypothetical protein
MVHAGERGGESDRRMRARGVGRSRRKLTFRSTSISSSQRMTATKRLPPKSPNVEQPPAKKQHTSFPSLTTNAFPCATRVDASSLSSSTPTDDAHYLSGKVIKRDFAGGTFNMCVFLNSSSSTQGQLKLNERFASSSLSARYA